MQTRFWSATFARALFAVAAVACGSTQAATTIVPFAPPTGAGLAATAPVNGVFPITSATSGQANWLIQQWGASTTLPGFVEHQLSSTVTAWTSAGTGGQVQAIRTPWGGYIMQLDQVGSNNPCGAASAPQEYDLFLAPNSRSFNPNYPSATLADSYPGVNLTLGAMKSMQIKGWVRLGAKWNPPVPSQCVTNQGSLIYSIVLKNTAVSPSQILYYQLSLTRLFCAPGTNPSVYQACRSYTPKSVFFEAQPLLNSAGQVAHYEYGIDEPAHVLGLPLQYPSFTATAYDFDLLPRLLSVIRAGSPSTAGVAQMDTNPNNWRVSTIYYGQHIWGNIGLESFWEGMMPVITE